MNFKTTFLALSMFACTSRSEEIVVRIYNQETDEQKVSTFLSSLPEVKCTPAQTKNGTSCCDPFWIAKALISSSGTATYLAQHGEKITGVMIIDYEPEGPPANGGNHEAEISHLLINPKLISKDVIAHMMLQYAINHEHKAHTLKWRHSSTSDAKKSPSFYNNAHTFISFAFKKEDQYGMEDIYSLHIVS